MPGLMLDGTGVTSCLRIRVTPLQRCAVELVEDAAKVEVGTSGLGKRRDSRQISCRAANRVLARWIGRDSLPSRGRINSRVSTRIRARSLRPLDSGSYARPPVLNPGEGGRVTGSSSMHSARSMASIARPTQQTLSMSSSVACLAAHAGAPCVPDYSNSTQ